MSADVTPQKEGAHADGRQHLAARAARSPRLDQIRDGPPAHPGRPRAGGDRQLPGLDGMCTTSTAGNAAAVSERYKLHYCRAFGIQPAQFAPGPIPEPAAEPAVLAIPAVATGPECRWRTGDSPCPPLSRYVPSCSAGIRFRRLP